jgi:hypothetical protein
LQLFDEGVVDRGVDEDVAVEGLAVADAAVLPVDGVAWLGAAGGGIASTAMISATGLGARR